MFAHTSTKYEYSHCRMFILKKEENDKYSFVGANYDINRNMFVETSLRAGEYIVLTQFFWEQPLIRTATISIYIYIYPWVGLAILIDLYCVFSIPYFLGSYSEKPISFNYLKNVDVKEMLKVCFKCVAIESVSRPE
jgi:hypothetical protein